jgi:hypothetical protein
MFLVVAENWRIIVHEGFSLALVFGWARALLGRIRITADGEVASMLSNADASCLE